MNKAKIITSALLATVLVAGQALPLKAEGDDASEVTKDESVYTVLNADGSIKQITVSDSLHSSSGFKNYKDTSTLTDVENLKSTDPVNSTNGGYIWNSEATDIYYQGTSTKELPLKVKITYTLNNKEYNPEDIVGKSGHVTIKISVTNSSKQIYTVGNKNYELVTPFITGLGAMLDDDNFTNVTVDHGTVDSDSSHSIIAGVLIPGLKSGLKQVLDYDTMSKLEDYLFDDITIEADTTSFESPTLMIAAATSTDDLKEDFTDTDFTSIFDQLDELKDATNKLIDGASTLADGAATLADGANKLNDGASSLLSGVDTLKDGTKTLYDGTNSATSGASKLKTGLGQLVDNNESLVSGANQIADAILQTANTQLAANPLIKNDPKYTELTWTNYADQLAYYYGVTDTMRAAALQEIKDTLKEKGFTISDENLNMVLYMAAKAGRSDLEAFMTENVGNLTTAANVQQAKADAASIATGDFSHVNRALNLGVYESVIGTIKSTVYNATKESTSPIILTDRQAEQIFVLAVGMDGKNIEELKPEELDSYVKSALSISSETPAVGIDGSINIDESTSVQMSTLVSGVRTKKGDATVYAALSAILKAEPYSLDNDTIAVLLTEGSEQHATDTTLATMITNVQKDVAIATDIATNLEASKTEEGQQIVKGYLNALVQTESSESIATLKALSTQLQSVATFRQGVKDYTTGVASAYDGSKSLLDGMNQLSSGAKKLNDGAATLSQGASSLKDGTQSLTEGANKLSDGAKTLYDGLVEYNDEGISKLTDDSRISSLEDASNLLNAVKEQGSSYNNYSGISEGTDGSVKFVFKVEDVKNTAASTTTEETTKTKTSFWDRIVNLFDFLSLFSK